MRILTCKSLLQALAIAGLLFLIGIGLVLLSTYSLGISGVLASVFSYAGFFMMLLSPLLAMLTIIAALLPGVGARLTHCLQD